ncbi:insulinase family protein [Micrococcales bacterium 31B]|nr:insulinase family protein [Micrococcales bacterium 31B]
MPTQFPLTAHADDRELILSGQDGDALVRRSILPGGVRVLTETDPSIRSVSLGAWIPVGSADETGGHFGSTHFLEHLLFKGTRTRSALDIAQAFDEVGGEHNAATGKEYTCYYSRTRSADLPMAVDIITDMIANSTITDAAFDMERGVILEEIAMNDDDPADVAHEKFNELVFGEHPLGRPIGGTPEAIESVSRDAVWEHYVENYRPATLTVAAAGDLDHDSLCELVAERLTAAGWDLDPAATPAPRRPAAGSGLPVYAPTGASIHLDRPLEQANLIVGGPGLATEDERRYVLTVFTSIFGGGMSSRLFQEVREERGLAYSVYFFNQSHAEGGAFGMYAGCTPGKVADVERLLWSELDKLAHDGLDEDELRRGIGHVTGSLVLGLEDTGSRMSRLGRSELMFGAFLTVDEVLDRIESVTCEEVQSLAQHFAAQERSRILVGPGRLNDL